MNRLAGRPETATAERIADAALAQFAEFGIRRSTLDDVAGRAGMARITVYRKVGNRDELVRLVLEREARRGMEQLDRELREADDPSTAIARGFAFVVRFVREHPLLGRLLRSEPETVLPSLTIDGGPFLSMYGGLISERLQAMAGRGTIDPANVARCADLFARLAVSLVLTPSDAIDTSDPDAVAAYAREVLLPVVAPVERPDVLESPSR